MASRSKPSSPTKKSLPVTAAAAGADPGGKPKLLSLPQFLQLFRDSREQGNDMRFCFILGSGASVQSKVPTGAWLTDIWLRTLHQQDRPGEKEDRMQAWAEEEFDSLPDFAWERRAEHYGRIYARRFPDNASGQAWLRQLMENKRPSFGYSVLAGILANSRHNLVITTNFDNLVHDALVALGKPRAYIAHSPEDAHFIPNHEDKPRILKLHGDIDRETYNAAALIDKLEPEWLQPLQHLLGAYTPVFIGYGGCDPGFMGFLNEIYTPSAARVRPVWAYRVDPVALRTAADPAADPPGRPETAYAATFAQKHQAWWLPTPGFDELMILLAHAMEVPHAGKEIQASAERLREDYQTNLTEALKSARDTDAARWCPQLDAVTRHAEQHLLGPVAARGWEDWREYIEAAATPDERIARVREAIAAVPGDPRPFGSLAWALHAKFPLDPEVGVALAQADALCAASFPPETEQALSVRGTRAWIVLQNGEYLKGEQECRAVYQLRTRLLGEDSPATLRARNGIASALWAQGKHAEAEAEHRAVLAIRDRVLGPEHPDTLASRNNLANALRAQGKNAEAEAEDRAVLAIRERVLGPEHPDTLSSRNNLANALRAQGKNVEAEAEHRAVLAIRERVLGPEHRDTLSSRNNLANALSAQGKSAEAEAEHRVRIKIEERALGPEHPDTLTSRFNLAISLRDLKKWKEAVAVAERALAGRRKVLGEGHPETKAAEGLVAGIKLKQAEAEGKEGE